MTDLLGGNMPLYLTLFAIFVIVILARRIPVLGTLVSVGMIAIALALVFPALGDRVGLDPAMERLARSFDTGSAQQVVGTETRIPMARDGHFWVRATVGGVEQRLMIDSGATITALSPQTAAAFGLEVRQPPFPVILQTANGSINAQTATIPELRIGNVVARDVPVVVSPAFGDLSVIGMNLLSRLKSWRVEGRTLILQPNHPQPVT